jgi:hypothetical protein
MLEALKLLKPLRISRRISLCPIVVQMIPLSLRAMTRLGISCITVGQSVGLYDMQQPWYCACRASHRRPS